LMNGDKCWLLERQGKCIGSPVCTVKQDVHQNICSLKVTIKTWIFVDMSDMMASSYRISCKTWKLTKSPYCGLLEFSPCSLVGGY
jgi:hypothetical protein